MAMVPSATGQLPPAGASVPMASESGAAAAKITPGRQRPWTRSGTRVARRGCSWRTPGMAARRARSAGSSAPPRAGPATVARRNVAPAGLEAR